MLKCLISRRTFSCVFSTRSQLKSYVFRREGDTSDFWKKCYRRKKEGKREKGKNWHFLTRPCQDDILYLLDDRCRKVWLNIYVWNLLHYEWIKSGINPKIIWMDVEGWGLLNYQNLNFFTPGLHLKICIFSLFVCVHRLSMKKKNIFSW